MGRAGREYPIEHKGSGSQHRLRMHFPQVHVQIEIVDEDFASKSSHDLYKYLSDCSGADHADRLPVKIKTN